MSIELLNNLLDIFIEEARFETRLYYKIKRSLGSQIVCNLRCKFYVRSYIHLDWRRAEEGEVEKHVILKPHKYRDTTKRP